MSICDDARNNSPKLLSPKSSAYQNQDFSESFHSTWKERDFGRKAPLPHGRDACISTRVSNARGNVDSANSLGNLPDSSGAVAVLSCASLPTKRGTVWRTLREDLATVSPRSRCPAVGTPPRQRQAARLFGNDFRKMPGRNSISSENSALRPQLALLLSWSPWLPPLSWVGRPRSGPPIR